MRTSAIKGFCFGLTSGIITTLGVLVGLQSGTGSRLVVIGGVLSIAIADSFSDALGIHVSEEADPNKTEKDVWAATFSTFFSKLVFSSTFIIPVLFLDLTKALIVSSIWGLSVLAILSYFVAKSQNNKPTKVIAEHLFIALLVIFITHYVGQWVSITFG